MSKDKPKVFVAISGGVDSSTAAALLIRDGFDCAGIFMITCDHFEEAQNRAQHVANDLAIELHVLDLRSDFNEILDYFCGEYARGRTPNPCVMCNRIIKFGKLWDFAEARGSDFFATGHYAKVLKDADGAGLYAADSAKDQSYALAMMERTMLEHLVLPMGSYDKQQTRSIAQELGLSSAETSESQEICFIPDDDYAALLEHRRPELVEPGDIVDSGGKVLGQHQGTHRYTIGQRKGLRVAMGKPYYVVGIDAETNTVILGPREELMHKKLSAAAANWLIAEPDASFAARVKIRYNDSDTPAWVYPMKNGVVEVEFDSPAAAITPGQLAVFYIEQPQGLMVAGGAWIDRAFD